MGLRLAPATSARDGDDAGTTVQGGGRLLVHKTDDGVTSRVRIDVWGGLNAAGGAGQLGLEAQGGAVADLGDDSYAFARVGLATELERNPYNGLLTLELPILMGGYQYHGDSRDDPLHLEIGPRAALALVGAAYSNDERATFVAAPQLGAASTIMGEAFAVDLSYARLFESEPLDVGRAMGCFALGLAVCLDGRLVRARFNADPDPSVTTFMGIMVGFGMATGLKYRRY